MNNHVIRYKGYIIDFTPFDAGNGEFGPRWAIAMDDDIWSGSVPLSSGRLMHRGTYAEATAIGKLQALHMIDLD